MNTPVELALPTTSKGQAPRDGLGPAPPQRMTGKDSPQFLRAASPIQHVTWSHQHIATIIRAEYAPDQTQFVTPDHYYQQAGFVVYAKGGDIRRHSHLPLQRHLTGTPETLIIRKGKIDIDLYAMDKSFLGTALAPPDHRPTAAGAKNAGPGGRRLTARHGAARGCQQQPLVGQRAPSCERVR